MSSQSIASMSVLKRKKGNETLSSRLTKWIDRLLAFDFEVVHMAGMSDYLSKDSVESLECGTLQLEEMVNCK